MSQLSLIIAASTQQACDELQAIIQQSGPYDAHLYPNIFDGVDAINDINADAILLDIDNSDISPETLCQHLNKSELDLPTLVISSSHSQEEEIEFYSAGIDDHIERPLNEKHLIRRIQTCIATHAKIKELTLSQQESFKMAMMTMANSSEMGVALQFIQESFGCHEHDEIAELTFKALANYSVEASIMQIEMGTAFFYFQGGIERPIERKVLTEIHGKKRIFEFNGRIIYTAPHVSLLTYNYPNDDEKIGRLKDHIAIIVDAIDSRIASIDAEFELQNKQDILSNIVNMTTQSIAKINEQHQQHREMNNDIMHQLALQLDESFLKLGLEPKQEDYLTQLVAETEINSDRLFQEGLNLDQEFNTIIDRINTVLDETKKVKFGL